MNRIMRVAAVAIALAAAPALAEDVRFAPGAETATADGSVVGSDSALYQVPALAGQQLTVRLESGNEAAYFDLLPPGGAPPLHAGARKGREFSGPVPIDGTYTVAVALARAAARRDEQASFTLEFGLSGAAEAAAGTAPAPEGGSEEPEVWEVTGLEPGAQLDLRAEPAAGAAVTAQLAAGAMLRNLGCRDAEGARWCQVEPPGDAPAGWVEARFLRAAPGLLPEAEPPAAGSAYSASGDLDCSLPGASAASCRYGVTRRGASGTTLVVTLPDGREQELIFDAGTVRTPAGDPVIFERRGAGTVVSVGGAVVTVPGTLTGND